MEPSLWDSFIESNMTFCISQLKAVFNIEKAYNHLQTSFIVRPWSPQVGPVEILGSNDPKRAQKTSNGHCSAIFGREMAV